MIAVSLATVAPLPRWVGWRNVLRKDKPTKIPFSPRTGLVAKANDQAGGARRTEAEAWARIHVNGSGGGVGLQLGSVQGEDHSFGGVDLDTCRDPGTGRIEPWALEVIARVGSYAEVSPSGTGVKLFLLYATADLPALRGVMGTKHGRQFKSGTGKHPPAIELHLSNRFFAVTDQHLEGTPVELRQVDWQTLLWILTQAAPRSYGRPDRDSTGGRPLRRARPPHPVPSKASTWRRAQMRRCWQNCRRRCGKGRSWPHAGTDRWTACRTPAAAAWTCP